jgi:hypothetical protein
MMSASHPDVVEFIGGPLDGHVYVVSSPSERLASNAAIPVNQNMVDMMGGAEGGDQMRATSIAMYVLESTPHGWKYRFHGAAPPEYFQFQEWIA